ncbi:MAG: 30S ribosomal protein S4 [Patescibacteria group bacterium]|nr:30S ribosomal protein S4 [Patescibacteria group bacterium]
MARNLDPKCKQCRREGEKLFLKGERCYSSKCAMVKRKYPPGQHGTKRTGRMSQYGIQLRQKQKAKRMYMVLEKQFKNYFLQARKLKGDTGKTLLELLERRLDNVVYRSSLLTSRQAARQAITHGHITVNSKKVDIPSYSVKKGDVVSIKETSKMKSKIEEVLNSNSGSQEIPKWLKVDVKKMTIQIESLPQPEDLPQDVDTLLITEFYSR